MPDRMIIAKPRSIAYLALTENEREEAKNQAKNLFGSSESDHVDQGPAPDVNFIYIGTIAGQGGWVVLVSEVSFKAFKKYLKEPFIKMYDFDIQVLNRTGDQDDVNTFDTMSPFGSWDG